jgi:hypothetical protein
VYANGVPDSGPLPKVLLPESCRRQIPQPDLAPLAIVKHVDVRADLAPGLLACCITPMVDAFVPERSPETPQLRLRFLLTTHFLQLARLGRTSQSASDSSAIAIRRDAADAPTAYASLTASSRHSFV